MIPPLQGRRRRQGRSAGHSIYLPTVRFLHCTHRQLHHLTGVEFLGDQDIAMLRIRPHRFEREGVGLLRRAVDGMHAAIPCVQRGLERAGQIRITVDETVCERIAAMVHPGEIKVLHRCGRSCAINGAGGAAYGGLLLHQAAGRRHGAFLR